MKTPKRTVIANPPAAAALFTHEREVTTAHQSTSTVKMDSKNSNTLAFNHTGKTQHELQAIAYTLAHEIRNPLTNINLSLELLSDMPVKEGAKEYLDVISRNTNRINELITLMLQSFSTEKEQRQHYSVNHLLDESLEMANDRINLKKIVIEKYYEKDHCEALLEVSIIRIAFLNIIINAIEAMEPNGVLKIMTSSRNGKCIVTIEDNGTGISPADIEKLFVPFFTTKPTGLGLGLSSALHILQSQQATIKVESKEGIGTKFIISF